ncbi:gliding motility-associated C-terminal domain-containing protein, partial [Desulfosarcina sp.]|nr:gliding motility-associated C-terminal domain-containing protein [Desulfosarcina sp.]
NGNFSTSPIYETKEEGPVIVEVSNVCGSSMDEAYVYIQPNPIVDLGCDIEMKYKEYISIDAGLHEAYTWSDGSLEEYCNPENPGTYWVEVSDALGCKSSDTICITPVPFTFHVPTAFTPNGDEINEDFKIFTSYHVQVDFDYEFFVYNRWGQLVFHTQQYPEFWDGTFNNAPCPTEVYTWILIVNMKADDEFFTKTTKLVGNVTLLR